jgi:hypothetical protein
VAPYQCFSSAEICTTSPTPITSSVLICFIIRVNPLETSGRHLTLAQLLGFKESCLTIYVDLLFEISFELVSKRLLL